MKHQTTDFGSYPSEGIASFVCELLVRDIEESSRFWTTLMGFQVVYQRPLENFQFLERPEGSQLMLYQFAEEDETTDVEAMPGRCVHQLRVDQIASIHQRLIAAGWPLKYGPTEVWRRWGDRLGGRLEMRIVDPDNNLILIAEDIGQRPISRVAVD